MKVYLISIGIRHPDTDKEELSGAIKTLSGNWWHHVDVWMVYGSDLSASGIAESLKRVLNVEANEDGDYDSLLVTEIGRDKQGWLPKKAWEWIREGQAKAT